MPDHQTPLIATIAAGLMLAFILGLIAHRLRVQPLVGYLLAGVLVGPYTPGFEADPALAAELAEIGVILLMFGVGLHFSLKDLLSVARIAVPGAIGQIVVATLMGMALSWALGWSHLAGFVFGLALSVASTVVLIRALQDRHILETRRGPHRRRLAGGRGPRHGAGPGAAAGAGHGDGGRRRSAQPHRVLPAGHPGQGVGVRGDHADRRPAVDPLVDASHGAYRLARAVPPRRLCHRAGRGLRRGQDVRRVVRARRLLRRHGDGRERPQPAGHRGGDAAARCLRRAVLRLRRHAAEPDGVRRGAAGRAGDDRHHRDRQVGCRLPDRARLPPFQLDRAHRRGQPRPDRRVLLHPDRAGHGSRHGAQGSARPHPGGRHRVDHPQPAGFHPDGATASRSSRSSRNPATTSRPPRCSQRSSAATMC